MDFTNEFEFQDIRRVRPLVREYCLLIWFDDPDRSLKVYDMKPLIASIPHYKWLLYPRVFKRAKAKGALVAWDRRRDVDPADLWQKSIPYEEYLKAKNSSPAR